MTAVAAPTLTRDTFLGGAVEALQPAGAHHRAGLEAVLLAAALPRAFAGLIVDLGAGAGIAGMCAVAQHPAREVVLVERDPDLTAAAREALTLPANRAFAHRVRVVQADVANVPALRADAVLMNPPFYAPGRAEARRKAPKKAAHVLGEGGLGLWFKAAAACLKDEGVVIAVARAADLGEVLAAAGGFGDMAVLPIAPRPAADPHRVIVRGKLNGAGDTRMLPAIGLHGASGPFRPEIESLLRGETVLDEVHETWRWN